MFHTEVVNILLHLVRFAFESKEEGRYQEPRQSSTTPDPGHHMGK